MTPAGRRPGDPDVTKQAILDAATEVFGLVGYDRATIRAIAAKAQVDPALVHHHFSNKHQLFAAAHELPLNPSELFAAVAELPVGERGAALAAGYLAVFTAPGAAALSLLRAAATNGAAATMLREFIDAALIEHSSRIVEGPRPELRMALVGSHLIGVVFGRELVGIEPLRRATVAELIETVAPVLQRFIDHPE